MTHAVFANGRFPRAQRVIETPSHPEKLVIAATYGLLVTEDRGTNWSYVCDAAFTFQTQFASDVVLGLTANGSMLLGVQKSVTRSTDRGCDFTKVLEPPGSSSIDDFTMTATNRDEVLALFTTFENGKNTIRLQESKDGGQTWTVIGAPIPGGLAYTIDVDPTNAQHIYVTAANLTLDPNEPALFITSSDRGASWSVATIPNTSLDSSPWIGAIHPRDGNKIFVRTDSWKKTSLSEDVAGDALLYSARRCRPRGPRREAPRFRAFARRVDGSRRLRRHRRLDACRRPRWQMARCLQEQRGWEIFFWRRSGGPHALAQRTLDMPRLDERRHLWVLRATQRAALSRFYERRDLRSRVAHHLDEGERSRRPAALLQRSRGELVHMEQRLQSARRL
jgi:hypothetical protein